MRKMFNTTIRSDKKFVRGQVIEGSSDNFDHFCFGRKITIYIDNPQVDRFFAKLVQQKIIGIFVWRLDRNTSDRGIAEFLGKWDVIWMGWHKTVSTAQAVFVAPTQVHNCLYFVG